MVGVQMTIALARTTAFPFLALFLIEMGVHPLSAVALWTGATVSIGFFMAAVLSPIWGMMADRVGRKAMVLRAMTATTISSALFALSNAAWQVFLLRALLGGVSGFNASATALVASQVPEGRLGFALGWMATGEVVGSLIGPLIGGVLADRFHAFRPVFFITAILAALAALSCLLLVRERFEPPPVPIGARAPIWKQFAELMRHPTLAPMFMVVLLAQVCTLGMEPMVPLFLRSLVDPGWVATAAGISAAATGLADMLASPWLGKRSDRIGYRRVLMISLAGAALFTIPLGLAPNYATFVSMRFGVGLFLGGILPTANAWIGRMFPPDRRGQVYGMTSSASFLGMAVGPILAAAVVAHFGFIAVFATMGAVMLVNLTWVAKAAGEDAHAR